MTVPPPNPYYGSGDAARILRGDHRNVVGGRWEEIGVLQRDFLIARGLAPHHALLDIGCGCLRGGVKFIRYLDAGNYYGIDVNAHLIAVGYDIELASEGLTEKLPRDNLAVNEAFDAAAFNRRFDFALAQSVFTHLPPPMLRDCLTKLAPMMAPGGHFFATIYEVPEDHPSGEPYRHTPGDTQTFGDRDPYHYRLSEVSAATAGLPWTIAFAGAWGHPRGQTMIEFAFTGTAG